MIYTGHRDSSMLTILRYYIPTAACLGGMCIGVLTIVADMMGAFGSGTGILMTVSTIYEILEVIKNEKDFGGLFDMF